MNREANIARFEAELDKVQRPGMGLLLEYIRRSDFYTAPASTHYHLSCEVVSCSTASTCWTPCGGC